MGPIAATEAVKALDAKIAETERELERLQREAELLPVVSMNLQALRRSRAILAGENPDALPHESEAAEGAHIGRRASGGMVPGSVGSLAVEILRAAGKPLNARELTERIRARGKKASMPTVVGALARYASKGILRRVGPSQYALAGQLRTQ